MIKPAWILLEMPVGEKIGKETRLRQPSYLHARLTRSESVLVLRVLVSSRGQAFGRIASVQVEQWVSEGRSQVGPCTVIFPGIGGL